MILQTVVNVTDAILICASSSYSQLNIEWRHKWKKSRGEIFGSFSQFKIPKIVYPSTFSSFRYRVHQWNLAFFIRLLKGWKEKFHWFSLCTFRYGDVINVKVGNSLETVFLLLSETLDKVWQPNSPKTSFHWPLYFKISFTWVRCNFKDWHLQRNF